MAINVSNLAIKISAGASGAINSLKQLNQKLDGTKKALGKATVEATKFTASSSVGLVKLTSGFTAVNSGIKLATMLYNKFGDEVKDSLMMSMEYIENLNLFNVSMGESADEAMRFQNIINEAFGTSLSDTVRYQAIFQQMASAIGLANKEAKLLSETMTKLGYDIASFYNISIEDAMSKLQAGLAGQTKPLRSLGMDITQQTMQPVLESLGINDRSVSQLTQAEKMILRYITVLRQSINAQTDMARTLDQPANQLRILKEQVKETGRWFGNVFIGTFGAVLPYINAVVMVLKQLLKTIATLGGFQDYIEQFSGSSAIEIPDGEDLSDNLGEAEKKSKKIKDNLQSIDEVHNLNEDTGSSGSAGVSIGGIDSRLLDAMKGYDNLMGSVNSKANEVRDKLMAWLGFTKQINEETQEIYFTYSGGGWSDVGTKLTEAFDISTEFLVEKINGINWAEIGSNINMALSTIDFSTIATGLHSVFGETLLGLQDLLLQIDFAEVLSGLGQGIADFFNSVTEYTKKLDMESFAQQITDTFASIPWADIVNNIISALWVALQQIVALLANIDWGQVAQTLSEAIGGILESLGTILGDVEWWWQLGETIIAIIFDFIGGIDWGLIAKNLMLGLMNGIVGFISLVLGAFEELVNRIKAFFGIHSPSTMFEGFGINIMEGLVNGVTSLIENVVNIFVGMFNTVKTEITKILTSIITFINGIPNKIATALKSVPEKFRQAFQNAKNKVSEIWKSVTSIFSKGGKIFDGIKEGIAETFKAIVNSLITGINKVISKPFNTINKTLNSIRNTTIPIIDVKPFSGLWDKNPIPVPQIPQLATGGFPDKGSLFIANEKAPELVGNIGNNTAVVNNEQIVQSVSRGVAQAVAGALANTNGEQEIYGEIDGEKLIKIVVKGVNGMTTKNGKFPFKLA